MLTAWHMLAIQTHETKAEGGMRIPGSGPFGCNCVGRLLAAKIVPAWASSSTPSSLAPRMLT